MSSASAARSKSIRHPQSTYTGAQTTHRHSLPEEALKPDWDQPLSPHHPDYHHALAAAHAQPRSGSPNGSQYRRHQSPARRQASPVQTQFSRSKTPTYDPSTRHRASKQPAWGSPKSPKSPGQPNRPYSPNANRNPGIMTTAPPRPSRANTANLNDLVPNSSPSTPTAYGRRQSIPIISSEGPFVADPNETMPGDGPMSPPLPGTRSRSGTTAGKNKKGGVLSFVSGQSFSLPITLVHPPSAVCV
ncbi:hypothetical protein BOTBODRAFT_432458 [Botryobasidium botryosum FD-172 SS1]|uniref:Uncharacterized protein n=1 Tax=Botryobasidium botryosum (strain FD-172 SS1) TaxID=930990 RepID=A0A067M8R2_BOTB1|nr:hypothetical protein BOTBODRAFT_432458 [Botryobasidium botryosum FD-172 SS1]